MSFIKAELRKRGITLHPDSGPVVKLPAGSLWTVTDVKRVFQKTSHFVCATSCWRNFVLLGWSPPLWAVFWIMAGAGLVAFTMWKSSSEAVQPSLGCRNDMDMTFALHGSTLGPKSILWKAAVRPGCYLGNSPEI